MKHLADGLHLRNKRQEGGRVDQSPFHKWLISQRRYCEHIGCMDKLTRATVVRNMNGRDTVLCDFHADLERETPTTIDELKPTRQLPVQ